MTIRRTTSVFAALAASLLLGSAAQAQGVTITLWHTSNDTAAELNMYTAWEQATGNKIERVTLPSASYIATTMTKWGTGSHPDLMEWFADGAFLAGLNPDENLLPLDDMEYIALSGGLYDSTGIWNGKVYSAMLHAPVLYGMFFNKDVLASVGVEAPRTYEELKAVCAAIKEKAPGVAPIFQAGGSSWPLTVLNFNLWGGDFEYGQKVAYNEATFGAEGSPFVDALTKFVELQDTGCYNGDILTATAEDGARALVEGKAAIMFQNTGQIPQIQAAAGSAEAMDKVIGFGSVGDEKPYANFQSNPQGVYAAPRSGDPAREAAALDFIRWASSEYYQTYVNDSRTAPTINLPGIQPAPDVSGLQRAADEFYATQPKEPLFNSNIAGFGEFVNLMPQLAAKQITPQQLADRLQAVVTHASMAAGVKGW